MLHGGGSRHPVRSRETQRGALATAARLLGALAHLPGPLCRPASSAPRPHGSRQSCLPDHPPAAPGDRGLWLREGKLTESM